jgi:hypothetical protein
MLKNGLLDLVVATGEFIQGKVCFLEQEQIPLDRPWRCLKILAQPGRGNLLPLHEYLEDLTEANKALPGVICNYHCLFSFAYELIYSVFSYKTMVKRQ